MMFVSSFWGVVVPRFHQAEWLMRVDKAESAGVDSASRRFVFVSVP